MLFVRKKTMQIEHETKADHGGSVTGKKRYMVDIFLIIVIAVSCYYYFKPDVDTSSAKYFLNKEMENLINDAEQGDAESQYKLAVFYGSGFGVSQNDEESLKWLTKAAEQGHVMALHSIGTKYLEGEGVAQDYVEAYKWFKWASLNYGDSSGSHRIDIDHLNELAKKLSPEQIAEAMVFVDEYKRKKKKKRGAGRGKGGM